MNNSVNRNLKTNQAFKILSVFGIVFVVLGHLRPGGILLNEIFPFYSFHMGLFAFISGYFFKNREPNEFFKAKIKKLILPYFIWNLIYGFLIFILKSFGIVTYGRSFSLFNIFVAPFYGSGNHFAFNVAAWFVISIFFIQVIYYLIYRLYIKIDKKNKIGIEILMFIISFAIAFFYLNYVKDGYNYGLYYSITRIIFLFPLYCVGQIYKRFENRIHINGIYTYLFFGLTILIQTILLEKCSSIGYNLQVMSFEHNYIIHFICNLTGIFFWLKVSKCISKYISNNRVIDAIGNNTFSIMMHHVFAFFILNSGIFLVNKVTGLFGKFDMNLYQNKFFYLYNKNPGVTIIYAIVGISLPLIGNYVFQKIKHKILEKIKINEKKLV